MRPSFLSRATLFSLSTTLAVLAVACSKDKLLTTTVFHEQPTPTLTPASPTPLATQSPAVDPHSFELGLDKAASGFTISKSANSKEDWNLVVSQFQDAIALMKQVSSVSPDFPSAQRKIKEYQIQIKYAKHKANSPVKVLLQPEPQPVVEVVPTSTPIVNAPLQRTVGCSNVETRNSVQHRCPSLLVKRKSIPIPVPSPEPLNQQPEVFTVPIKRRAGGTPIIEVTFNGNQRFDMILDTGASGTVITQEMAFALGVVPVGKAKANTASSKAVVFPIGYVDSIEVGGVIVHQTAVAIAGSDLETGLLGHDFFGEYDITIKRDVVEFRPQSNSQFNSAQTQITPTPPQLPDSVESP